MPGIVDAHGHLQHERFDADRDAVIERARQAGIVRILVPGWDLPSSEAALELAARHRGFIDAAIGVHPHDAATMVEADWGRLERLVRDPAVRAVGEIGLDFYRRLSPPSAQRESFERQLTLAAEAGLPVVVHDRDAHAEITDVLLAWAGRDAARAARPRGMLHAFSGDEAMARHLAAAGFLVSFALPLTFRSAAAARAAATALPHDAVLVETDAPYLGPASDTRNEPTTVLRVAAELARLRGEPIEELAAALGGSYRRLIEG